MSAISRIVQQENLVEVLQALVELVKNPSAIKEAQAVARTEFSLTKDEQEKADDARKAIGGHRVLAQKMEKLTGDLEKKRKEHDDVVQQFAIYQEEERKRINETNDMLLEKETSLKRLEKLLADRTVAIDENQAVVAKSKAETDSALARRQALLDQLEVDIDQRKEAISAQEIIIKEKFDKLKSIID